MDVLYKYYSDKLDADYFDKPTLKLTSSATLNDPFEKIVPSDLDEMTLEMYSAATNKDSKIKLSRTFNNITNRIYNRACGIVSLSETPRNILMWSHYTNQHKGICIGYKSNMLVNKEKENPDYPCHYQPIKINYDNRRFDKYTDIIKGATLSEVRREILTKSLTTKSNDWMYEKEHRLIIPMLDYDDIKYIGKDSLSLLLGDSIEITSENTFKVRPGNEILINNFLDSSDYMFRKDINKSDIVSIYFGCDISQKYKFEILKKIQSGYNANQIKLFQITPHKNEFELIPRPVDIKLRHLFSTCFNILMENEDHYNLCNDTHL
ncbi:DUF2971 domain-containing protein [Aeromonas hydrophila]|uniref:DUF2971 domain-containing protein n=1 Tax=Aeromonas hydrophila TaxID=644 RepID=UPI00191F71CE|nr:DUF2971 domain-containing protein [Aeromonas hydrophila]MBL0568965.1 DUF2971 domain-containing protein [Aeromonas hydrophila]